MALSEKQLLLLDCFMYSDLAPNSKGDSLQNVIELYMENGKVSERLLQKAIDNKTINLSGDMPGHADYLADVMQQIYNDDQLKALRITQTTKEVHGGIRAACFVDGNGNATVAFRGTGGSYQQWRNNFEGYGDISQQTQRDAVKFINSLPYDNITVTGHSNGADAAMYSTVMCGDKISRCVGFEGQGVSKECLNDPTFKSGLEKNKSKIKNISGSKDFVNIILYPIAGETVYVYSDSEIAGGLFNHGSYGILKYANDHKSFDDDGNFKDSAYVEQSKRTKVMEEVLKVLAAGSDVPVLGRMLELIADGTGILVGMIFDFRINPFDPETWKFWDKVIKDIRTSIDEFIAGVTADLIELGEKILNKVKEKIIEDFLAFKDFVTEIGHTVGEWLKKHVNKGYKYATENPMIRLDTQLLQNYADRINSVNKRITNLDWRLKGLYSKAGLLDIFNLIQADLLTSFSPTLLLCSASLNSTAKDFEDAESDLFKAF